MTAAARTRAARPAQFAPDPHRRAMIAKKKQLALEEEDYRLILDRVTGKRSAGDMTAAQLDAALKEMGRLGWQPSRPGGAPGQQNRPTNPAAAKARAMLISLGLLGVIRNPTEAALNAFARRQIGVDRLSWADQSQVYKLIEALKAIANRNGWDQSTAGLADPVWTLKLRLCEAILKRLIHLGAVPAGTSLAVAAGHSEGAVLALTERELEALAARLGDQLARAHWQDHYEG